MKSILSYLLLIALFLSACTFDSQKSKQTADEFAIIPKPNTINLKPQFKKSETAFFLFKNKMQLIVKDSSLQEIANLAAGLLNIEIVNDVSAPLLILKKEALNMPNEGYHVNVHSDSIIIAAESGAGVFYGIQSLAQLLPVDWVNEVRIPVCQIDDSPRFPYRGMHLDVCRHFYSVDFVKKYIDLMARYKLNTFHWHLTEDQGWRIEIKKYPKLTEVGAWRIEKDGTRYGGFYTQEQIRDVINYATKRFITIIPEIELPGHSRAALAAYPQYSCSGEELPVANQWGVFEHVYCAGNDSTFLFLQDVLDEVIALFPGTYIHIGGDECPKSAWEKCSKCQARIKNEGLSNEHELQSYFIRRIEKYLTSQGRKLIGWDEILEGGLAPDATVMSWRGIKGGIAAAQQKHYVIMTPGTHCYFDHYQANPKYEPKAIGGYTTVKRVYSYEPIPEKLNADEGQFILGAQANMWTEYIATEHHLEYMLLPRMIALAEVNWTLAKHKNWDDFNRRLQAQFLRLDREGTNYCPGDYTIHFEIIANPNGGDSLLKMESEIYQARIHYTLNGDEPQATSPLYSTPIKRNKGNQVKASIIEYNKAVNGCSVF